MAKFKKGDRITNGKIEYTVLDIVNAWGEECYTFKHPIRKTGTFVWFTSQVDEIFILAEEYYKKKYEEALERMKSWAKGEHPECFTEAQKAAEFVFPELKVNKNELMRKEAISIIKQYDIICEREGDKCYTANKVISWLENLKI